MSRSNFFAEIENEFKTATKEIIHVIALVSTTEIVRALSDIDGNTVVMMLLLGAKTGIDGDGFINDDEKELVRVVFENSFTGDLSMLYESLSRAVDEKDFKSLYTITRFGHKFAMSFLRYILSFAYIDGEIKEETAKKLDSIFGESLLFDFFQNGPVDDEYDDDEYEDDDDYEDDDEL